MCGQREQGGLGMLLACRPDVVSFPQLSTQRVDTSSLPSLRATLCLPLRTRASRGTCRCSAHCGWQTLAQPAQALPRLPFPSAIPSALLRLRTSLRSFRCEWNGCHRERDTHTHCASDGRAITVPRRVVTAIRHVVTATFVLRTIGQDQRSTNALHSQGIEGLPKSELATLNM